MTDDDDAPLFPVMAYTVGVVEGTVVFRVEYAASQEQYGSRSGEMQQYVLTPDAAIAFGRALAERGALAANPGAAH